MTDNETRFAAFFGGYIEALYFTESGPDSELDPGFKADQRADCLRFWAQAWAYIPEGVEVQAGHDFWFSRNGDGTGFWDRDDVVYGDATTRDALDKLADSFGPVWEVIWQ